jgi:hypothetical protein
MSRPEIKECYAGTNFKAKQTTIIGQDYYIEPSIYEVDNKQYLVGLSAFAVKPNSMDKRCVTVSEINSIKKALTKKYNLECEFKPEFKKDYMKYVFRREVANINSNFQIVLFYDIPNEFNGCNLNSLSSNSFTIYIIDNKLYEKYQKAEDERFNREKKDKKNILNDI